jgi:drug/metabolite transporter (DMT)-like permease
MFGFALPREERLRGILCIVTAMFLFSVMAALSKYLSARYSTFEIVFLRHFFGFIPLLPLLVHKGGVKVFKTKQLGAHAWRTAIGLCSLMLYFWSLAYLPLAEAFVISFSSPICITLMSVWLLKEHVSKGLWAAIFIGFSGVVIAIWPTSLTINPGIFIGLAAIPFYSYAMISMRKLAQKDSGITLLAYFTLFSTLFSAIPAAFAWSAPAMEDFLVMAACGIVGGCGQIFLIKAYQQAPPQVLSPFNYTSIIWGTLFGIFFWGDIPVLHMWVGAAIVIASGVYIARREKVLKAPLANPPQPQ